jgi:alanine transaminase
LVAGAYSQSTGIDLIRRHVADFITRRDGCGIPAIEFNNVCLFNGASEAIRVSLFFHFIEINLKNI